VIIHYVKSKIVAFSRARTDGGPCTVSLAAHYPFTPTHCWYGHNPDWYFETEYYDLAFPIPRDTFNQQLARLKTDAVLSNGNVRQAYFIPFRAPGDPAVQIIGQAINPHEPLPDWARAAFGLATTPQTSTPDDPTRPIPPPVPLTLDPSLIPLRRQQIENQYQGYRERREQVLTSLKLRTEQGNAELMKLYRYQVDRLDKEIASMLATMTERARQESTELRGMSRNALLNEIARLRDLTAAYERATDAAFALYEGLNDAARHSLERHGVPQDVLNAFFGTLNDLEMALVSDTWAREQAEDASSSSAA
jgi:hypothetical protein